MRAMALLLGALSALALMPAAKADDTLVPYTIVDDAIPLPLTATPTSAERGRAIVLDRATSACLLCHAGPFSGERFLGTIGPDLRGVGTRLSTGQLRLRLVDPTIRNPDTMMPPYYRVAGLTRVTSAFAGRPILNAQQIEDVVAFLATLRE
jgi:sulfur-oxidizing protein SoxX